LFFSPVVPVDTLHFMFVGTKINLYVHLFVGFGNRLGYLSLCFWRLKEIYMHSWKYLHVHGVFYEAGVIFTDES
jgi:hypothetical protein